MNIVVENIWDYVQNNPNLTRKVESPPPTSSQYIMMNTMADLCIGGEMWCESLEADFGMEGMENGGGGGGCRRKRMGKTNRNRVQMARDRRGIMRTGMMRSVVMKKTMSSGGGGLMRAGCEVHQKRNDAGHVLGEHRSASVPPDEKMNNLECFTDIVNVSRHIVSI